MIIRKLLPEEKAIYNQAVYHPLQTWEWGEFKESLRVKIERVGEFEGKKLKRAWQIFFHSLPGLKYTIGYFPKGPALSKKIIPAIMDLTKENKTIFVKFEPEQISRKWQNNKGEINPQPVFEKIIDFRKFGLIPAKKTLFAQYSFVLDLTKSENELLANMHSKTRYNIRLAERKGVIVEKDNSRKALTIFLDLLFSETVKRQGFYMHNPEYFQKMWAVLEPAGLAHLFLAKYKEQVLSAWMVFVFKDRIFYPYGASSSEMRNLMASNLLCWKIIQFAKRLGCKSFDMWGSLGPAVEPTHPWYGFHRFKLGYGGELVESVGSWDLVINKPLYQIYNLADWLRWKVLRIKRSVW